ncbi:MAG: hypothetical protein IJP54_03275 [Synergistaceae bacterium]|nr:hypothetical protein [Synergistaceae bacterium]MBR0034676.1 hypothetical protein [Synergistaceae bacterium]
MSITFTPTGCKVSEDTFTSRIMQIPEVQDFRLQQIFRNAYRIILLPQKGADIRGLKGSVLDALVDVYGMRANYDIDIITEDDSLMPECSESSRITFLTQ